MYNIKTNGVRDDVVNSGAIKTVFDALSKRLGNTDFEVSITAYTKDDNVTSYECDIMSQIIKGDLGHVDTKGEDLLSVCREASDMYFRRWRAKKTEWKKQQKNTEIK